MSRAFSGEVDARVLPGLLQWCRVEMMREKFGDGQAIEYVFDESGNGIGMGQPTAAARPVMKYSGCNGYASAVFDGTNDELYNGTVGSAGITHTAIRGMFALMKQTATGNWASGDATSGLAIGSRGVTGNYGSLRLTNGALTMDVPAGGITGETFWVNGANVATVTDAGAWNLLYVDFGMAARIDSIAIGRREGGTVYMPAEWAEWGVFTGTPSAAQRTAFFAAMVEKYALTGAVGSPA